MSSSENIRALLTDLLDVEVPSDFFASYYGNRPCHLHPRHSRPPPFGWNDLNRVLRSHRLLPPRIRVAHSRSTDRADQGLHGWAATRSPIASPVLRRSALHASLEDGGTLIIDSVNELTEKLRELNIGLSGALQDPVGMNCYASFGQDASFGPHWDEHDVFAFQLDGQKHWTLFFDSAQIDKTDFLQVSDGRPHEVYAEILLEQGAILYLPRGFWHEVVGTGRPSLHVSIGVARRRAIDVLRSMVERLESDPIWGATIPRFVGEERDRRFEDELTSALDRLAQQPICLDDYRNEGCDDSPLPLATNLPWAVDGHESIDDRVLIFWLGRLGRLIDGPDGSASLRVGGAEIDLNPTARSVIELISAKPRHVGELAELLPKISRAQLRQIVGTLAKRGLIEMVQEDACIRPDTHGSK